MEINKETGAVMVELDRVRALKFDFNGLVAFEEEMGISVTSLFQKSDASKIGLKVLRALFWAALLYDDPKLSIMEAGRLMERLPGRSIAKRMETLGQLISMLVAVLAGGEDGKKKLEDEALTLTSARGGTGPSSSA